MVSKQEEIREGVEQITSFICIRAGGCTEHDCDNCTYPKQDTQKLLSYLPSKGVVIKVDELPCFRCKGSGEARKWQEQYVGEGYWVGIICPKCKGTGKSGYVVVIPLIKEG